MTPEQCELAATLTAVLMVAGMLEARALDFAALHNLARFWTMTQVLVSAIGILTGLAASGSERVVTGAPLWIILAGFAGALGTVVAGAFRVLFQTPNPERDRLALAETLHKAEKLRQKVERDGQSRERETDQH